ncbi:MAG: hypothetical protein KKI02_07830 [Planctomycetes bacterium]|nr:hypothetical protein [Planctomycetota bacterium]
MRRNYIIWIAAIGLLCAGPAFVLGQMDTHFSYQGQILEAGEPVTDLVSMRFSLWDAAAGGLQLGTDYSAMNVDVVDGLFTVQIDSANFGSSGFNGDPRWLEIEVYDAGWQTLSPRQPITPAPYALFAADSPGGGGTCLWSENGTEIYYNIDNVGIGTADPNVPLHVTTSSDPVAVLGKNTATSGSGSGVWGETGSSTGSGVFGQNINNGTGNHAGVKGVAWGSFAQGVMGYNGSTASTAIGVLGRTSSGVGVKGEATHTSASTAICVHGQSSSPNGYGVYGYAPTSGKGVAGYSGTNDYGYLGWNGGGVYGSSVDGYGVRGFSTNDWGVFGSVPFGSTQAGVIGAITLSNGAIQWVPESGVCGSSEDGKGVSGRVDGGIAVYGIHDDTGNIGHLATFAAGVYGETDDAGDYGVYGKTTGNYSTTNGVYGQATGATWGIGVRGSVSNTNGIGVYGYNDGGGAGGQFYSDGGYAGSFVNYGDHCVHIDHDDNGTYNTAALKIESTGSNEPVGMDVHVDAEYGRLAYFHLDNADLYYGTAFHVTADNIGAVGQFDAVNTNSDYPALRAQHSGSGTGVVGTSISGVGVYGNSQNNVAGKFNISYLNNSNAALEATTAGGGNAIYAEATATTDDDPAIYGRKDVSDYYGIGVRGRGGYRGVEGQCYPTGSSTYTGVYAYVSGGTGTNRAVYGAAYGSGTNYAGYFSGNLHCTGTLSKGGGTFMIDHPLDPENKYLYHSFVESPDMMNVYNGNVVLDANGEAVVTMPEWFEVLNREFRYQLTPIGAPGPNLYIAEEISDNQFAIAGGKPGLKVSWQVTGVRQDPFAEAHRVQVEVDKPEDEIGTYLHPEEWGVSPDLQVDRVHEARRQAEMDEIEID